MKYTINKLQIELDRLEKARANCYDEEMLYVKNECRYRLKEITREIESFSTTIQWLKDTFPNNKALVNN